MKTAESVTQDLPRGHLSMLREISQQVNEGREFLPLLYDVSNEASEALEAERASVFLLDKHTCELWSLIALPNETIRFDARLGIAGAVAMTGETINVTQASKDSRFHKGIDAQTKYRTRSVLAVPLQHLSGEIIGTFQFLNKKKGSFTQRDEQIAKTLATYAAQALTTVGLVEELQRKHRALEQENHDLRSAIGERATTQAIIGMSPPIQQIVRTIDQVSDCSFDVLITGESGTGKELVAKAIHENSPRAKHSFIELNCAALPENLVESELFGIRKGMATGVDAHVGKFEQAQGGTLFLDEIGDLALSAQTKILRVLQERRLEPIGKRESIPIDVRVIVATNVNLEEAISQGTFRQDLYYRLKVIHIATPPLREIQDDIPLLANFFLLRYCNEVGVDAKHFAPRALQQLQHYQWPGNVRQLENEIKRLAVMIRGDVITLGDLDLSITRSHETPARTTDAPPQYLKASLEMLEQQLIEESLQFHQYHQGLTAQALGLSRQGLIKKMKRFRIEVL